MHYAFSGILNLAAHASFFVTKAQMLVFFGYEAAQRTAEPASGFIIMRCGIQRVMAYNFSSIGQAAFPAYFAVAIAAVYAPLGHIIAIRTAHVMVRFISGPFGIVSQIVSIIGNRAQPTALTVAIARMLGKFARVITAAAIFPMASLIT